jgi:hypothetical protein
MAGVDEIVAVVLIVLVAATNDDGVGALFLAARDSSL